MSISPLESISDFRLPTRPGSSFRFRSRLLHLFVMASSLIFTLLGDSNIKRHLSTTSFRALPSVKASQILSCGHLGIFRSTLDQVRPESNVCIVSCLTNFLTRADGPDSVAQRINPVLLDIREALDAVCEASPDRHFLLSPPMYRTSPVWYREGLPEVLTMFSQFINQDRPQNLHIMSSFATPSYEADGIHLTSFSGLEFLLHLFEGAENLVNSLSQPQEATVVRTTENTRVLEDRVMALEQDHRRLNKVVEEKIAIDAELADFRRNESDLDAFMIAGIPDLGPDLVGKDWQDRAVSDVQDVIKILMGRNMDILFIQNATKRYEGAEITYCVRMREIADSRAIRTKFGTYFVGMKDKRPPDLKKYSIRNRVTAATKIRRAVLQVLGKRYKDANAGSKVQVISYEPRPRLKITPPPTAKDRRVQVRC